MVHFLVKIDRFVQEMLTNWWKKEKIFHPMTYISLINEEKKSKKWMIHFCAINEKTECLTKYRKTLVKWKKHHFLTKKWQKNRFTTAAIFFSRNFKNENCASKSFFRIYEKIFDRLEFQKSTDL